MDIPLVVYWLESSCGPGVVVVVVVVVVVETPEGPAVLIVVRSATAVGTYVVSVYANSDIEHTSVIKC